MKRIATTAVAAAAAATLTFGIGVTAVTAATVSPQASAAECRSMQDAAKADYEKAKTSARDTFLRVKNEQKAIADGKIAALKKVRDEKKALFDQAIRTYSANETADNLAKLQQARDAYYEAANAVGPGMSEARDIQRGNIAEATVARNTAVAEAKKVRDNAIAAARAMC